LFYLGRGLLAEETFEGIESAFPEAAILGDPVFGLLQGSGREPAETRAADFFLGDEAGVLKHADVLHDRREGHAMRAGEVREGGFAKHEGSKDGTAGGVGKGAKGGIKGCGILNHVV